MFLSVQALLSGLIDYAGLFPPAGLGMEAAVGNYSRYLQSPEAWMLGRFIVPVSRLSAAVDGAAWRLSALGGDDIRADIERIGAFNARNAGRFEIDVIELRAVRQSDVQAAMAVMPAGLTPYFEIPIGEDPTDSIRAISEAGGRAKVRTGAVTADGIPSSWDLARFIKACAEEDVAFKATAGLHHPVRATFRLTYAPDSDSAMMHGFLNVFLAAAFAYNGLEAERLLEVLEETSPEAFVFESGSISWRDQMTVRGQLRVTRSEFAIAFGSCSFEEPVDDLKRMNLI